MRVSLKMKYKRLHLNPYRKPSHLKLQKKKAQMKKVKTNRKMTKTMASLTKMQH